MSGLLDWFTWWTTPPPPPPPTKPQPSAKTFIIIGEFGKAWRTGKGSGKINGQPCTLYYKDGVVTVTLT